MQPNQGRTRLNSLHDYEQLIKKALSCLAKRLACFGFYC